jgi:hypothetical protein
MTRKWQPKYKVRCSVCGWTGKRTHSTMHYACPRCYPLGKPTTKDLWYDDIKPTVKRVAD